MTSTSSQHSTATSPPSLAPAAPYANIKQKITETMETVSQNSTSPVSRIGPKKTWIVPPRPKPGRKPATDTPPTRRKAQNRAAQRAFRERRAARVGELEEQLKETEERRKREHKMQDQRIQQTEKISKLEQDVRRLKTEVDTWCKRYAESQRSFECERVEKDAARMELAYLRNGSRATGTSAVPLPPRRQQPAHYTSPVTMSMNGALDGLVGETIGCGECSSTSCPCMETVMSVTASGCGSCTVGSHCDCLQATLEETDILSFLETDHKRPNSTKPGSDDVKRPRFSIEQTQQQEIDFTTQFSLSKGLRHVGSQDQINALPPHTAGDSCGFCAEGTYCACAEAEDPLSQASENEDENRLAPLLYGFTPPPSDSDDIPPESSTAKIPPLHPNHRIHHSIQVNGSRTPNIPSLHDSCNQIPKLAQESCGGDPGSCKQCQQDPRSGLFCRSLAALRASSKPTSQSRDQCCGASETPGSGCCRQRKAMPPVTLSCADAYRTLASHEHFDKASDTLSEWLPKLEASVPQYPARTPLDIEAASVMHVIKYFDVRFGRD